VRERLPQSRIAAAHIGAPFGIHGELACFPTRVGDDALHAGMTVHAEDAGGAPHALEIATLRRHHGRALVAFSGISTIEAARAWSNATLYIERAEVVLHDGEFLDDDLVGLRVVDPAGRALGTVGAVQHFPAQDCLVVEPGGAFVPMVRAFIRAVDLHGGTVTVDVPEGLLDPHLADEA
jgi:16S rRNA processing protein RimM